MAESSACLVLFETGASLREENVSVENYVNCLACSQKPSRRKEKKASNACKSLSDDCRAKPYFVSLCGSGSMTGFRERVKL